eukprot:5103346-Pleurochrysis_carterae.AAC.2
MTRTPSPAADYQLCKKHESGASLSAAAVGSSKVIASMDACRLPLTTEIGPLYDAHILGIYAFQKTNNKRDCPDELISCEI